MRFREVILVGSRGPVFTTRTMGNKARRGLLLRIREEPSGGVTAGIRRVSTTTKTGSGLNLTIIVGVCN